jgi:hypothetical protein
MLGVTVIFQDTNATSAFALPLVACGDGDDIGIVILRLFRERVST